MTTDDVLNSLSCQEYDDAVLLDALQVKGEAQRKLFELASSIRHQNFPNDMVQVRSVIEVSNV